MNGQLHNHDLYNNCLNEYKVTFKDGTVRYTRAKCKYEAEEKTCWFGDTDKSEDILTIEEI